MKIQKLNESKTGYQYKGYVICYGYKGTDRWYIKDSSDNFVGTKSGYSTEVEAKEYIDSLNESKSIRESWKKGDRAILPNGQTGTVGKDFDWKNEDQVQVVIDGTNEIKYVLSDILKEIRDFTSVRTFDAKSKKLDESNPMDLTDCPACGGISFDSRKGKCTKCAYKESLTEGVQPADEWYLKWKPEDTEGAAELKGLFVDDMIKDKDNLDKYNLSPRLTAILEKIFANYLPVKFVDDEKDMTYFVGDKEVPYTSYEDAKAHMKDDYKIEDYRDELQAYIDSKTGRKNTFFVNATFDGRLCIDINWGDWKHEHGYADQLVREFFNEKGLRVDADVEVTEEDGGDAYSATHYYDVSDIYFSGRVVKESLKESATHCVYFTQDGRDQIEFEGTEDECNNYISAIQAEQDDEFGDEAPERFIKRLTEATVFGHNIIHVGDDLVSKSGHKIHIDDIVATLSPFEKNAIVTFYYTYEMTNGETGSSQCSTFDLQNMLNESLNEDIEEEARTAGRYLDYEVPEMCAKVLELVDNLPESKLAFIAKVCRDFNAKLEYVLDSYTMTNNESLTEDIETETLEGPKEGPEYGLASLLNSAIQEEYKTVESYNSLALTAADEGFDDIVDVINEINTEENKHIGQLQELLKTVAPNAEAIDIGVIEGEQQIEENFNVDDNDFDLATEFGINGDDDISDDEMKEALNEIEKAKNSANNSTNIPNNINDGNINEIEEEVVDMREAWEDIYDSFKKIETDLNGDGEAITATIDRIYQDNKGNPDFKKAYDKWASGN